MAEGYDYKQVLELEDLDRQLQEAKANQDLPEAEYNSQIAEIEDQINGIVPKNRELTAQGRREMSALRNEFIKNFKDFKPAELPELYKSLGFAEEQIAAMDALREREKTAQERFEESVVYDKNGNPLVPKGAYVPLPSDKGEEAAAKQRQKYNADRAQFSLNYALNEKKSGLSGSFDFDAAMKEGAQYYDKAHGGAPAQPGDVFGGDPLAAMRGLGSQQVGAFVNDVQRNGYPAPQPAPTPDAAAPAGAAQPATTDERKKKWGNYAD